MTDKEEQFLIGLEKLTRETGIVICGCGCCGSPYLDEVDITDDRSGYACTYGSNEKVTWIDASDEFDWKEYSEMIIK